MADGSQDTAGQQIIAQAKLLAQCLKAPGLMLAKIFLFFFCQSTTDGIRKTGLIISKNLGQILPEASKRRILYFEILAGTGAENRKSF